MNAINGTMANVRNITPCANIFEVFIPLETGDKISVPKLYLAANY